MELRKVEQELDHLIAEWKALRRKRPRFADGDEVADASGKALWSSRMPPWTELRSRVKDEDIFPPEEEAEDEAEGDDDIATETGDDAGKGEGGTDATNGGEAGVAEEAGYSEFGMCLASSGNADERAEGTGDAAATGSGGSIFERYAAKSATVAKPKAVVKEVEKEPPQPMVVDEEVELAVEDASPADVLAGLESLKERFAALRPKIDKFLKKLNDRDPVTKKPRYGEKTIPRVKEVIRIHTALEQGIAIVFEDAATGPSVVSSLRSLIQQHTERMNAKMEVQQSKEQLEAERLAKEKAEAEERANQQRLLEEQKKREEEAELARLAEEARKARVEEEQRALEAERQADEDLLALVPTKGAAGVREQIGRMREALKDDRAAFDVALGSLHTLFEQIVRKPEEANFRRVRRDHPKFVEDIGRHVGGREVLIAAGFKLEKQQVGDALVPCFFSKEPHIESDMDGWSEWFDTNKKTLAVIEEEMLK